jgi:hypothetical protein
MTMTMNVCAVASIVDMTMESTYVCRCCCCCLFRACAEQEDLVNAVTLIFEVEERARGDGAKPGFNVSNPFNPGTV